MAKAYRVTKQCFIAARIRVPGDVVVDDEFTGPVPSSLELIEDAPDPEPEPDAEVAVSDAARALADEYGVILSHVQGSGKDGGITIADVRAYIGKE